MNRFIFSFVFFLPFLFSCQKDDDKIKSNYIECNVNNEPVLVYLDPKLNKAGETFSFALSKEVTVGKTDTVLTLRADTKGKLISITFPKTDRPKKYSIFQKNPTQDTPHGSFQNLDSITVEKGLEVFYTSPWPYEKNENFIDVVGEISITYANIQKNEYSGTFKFTAFGYYHTNNGVYKSDNTVEVTDGSFHGIWPNHHLKKMQKN